MSETRVFRLVHAQARRGAIEAVQAAPDGWMVTLKPEKRSDIQNRRMWAMLHDVSEQVDWYGKRLTEEEWKDVFTAALKKQKVVPGIDGGFVVCGTRTSKMTRGEMSELQELMAAFGAEHDVVFEDLPVEDA